ncbi:MAG: class I SAM-dependent DNA methyltransferase [Acidimicrobiales bacterium]
MHAGVFDGWFDDVADAEATVEFLAGLAGTGPVLELGIGTGRIALPLAARGIPVHGIDAAEAMVERLRAKPGGQSIRTVIADFSLVEVEGSYRLIYVIADTFFNLVDQEAQVRCFQNAARHLGSGGSFVVDVSLPDPGGWASGRAPTTRWVRADEVVLRVVHHDPVDQTVLAQHVALSAGGVSLYPNLMRYAWPAEMDLMARLAGLTLRRRWGGWRGERYGLASRRHVSVYELRA